MPQNYPREARRVENVVDLTTDYSILHIEKIVFYEF